MPGKSWNHALRQLLPEEEITTRSGWCQTRGCRGVPTHVASYTCRAVFAATGLAHNRVVNRQVCDYHAAKFAEKYEVAA